MTRRVAFLSGAAGGMGFEIAKSLAEAGCDIAINGIVSREMGVAAAESLSAEHGCVAEYFQADLSQPEEIEAMIVDVEAKFGRIDIIVNNAVTRHFSPVESFDPADWQKSLDVNLSAPFHLARLIVPGMKRRHWGRIINISSLYGNRGAENRIDYVTTKTALIGMARALAIELARTGITANAVCPGSVGTDAILDRIRNTARDDGGDFETLARDYAAARNPMGRFVSPKSVGAIIAFLCSDAGGDISGATVPVDGGWLVW